MHVVDGTSSPPLSEPNATVSAETSAAAANVLPAIDAGSDTFPPFLEAQLSRIGGSVAPGGARRGHPADDVVRGATAAVILSQLGELGQSLRAWIDGGTS